MTKEKARVIVVGATPGGIGAALATARRGLSTLLIESSPHIGGMMTSGLGRTDIRSLEASGAIFREFTSRVFAHYTNTYGEHSLQVEQCNRGLFFEPSVAKKIFWEIINQEHNLEVRLLHELISADVKDKQLSAITVQQPGEQSLLLEADLFIDATYEGDLAALSGVPYVTGRESRDDWNEEFAGKLYMNFDVSKEVFPGSTGEGDDRIQAYNFRLCLTKETANRVDIRKPAAYRQEDYASLIRDVQEGRINSIGGVSNMLPLPNGKTDCNNHHYCMCSTDLPEENGLYPEGDRPIRQKIVERHRQYIQGLLWFLQNDPGLPEEFRNDAKQWGYAADEFQDTEHFPPQIYVREARRIKGEYTFTENDARLAPGLDRAPIHFDSIAVGDYAIDSHAARIREPAGKDKALEGFLGLGWLTEIYQIPFGVMVPKEIDRLLVPVAVSATHMGFGTIRMEPFWMQLGFAAGIAVDISLQANVQLRNLPVDRLQDELLACGQRITFFKDVEWAQEDRIAAEYFGTKGFFTSYTADLDQPLQVDQASRWVSLARILPGGKGIPVLPAANELLPAGIDMGPRLPRKEPSPHTKWHEQRYLNLSLAKKWLQTAAKALDVELDRSFSNEVRAITKGEFCTCLYILLKNKRKQQLMNF